MGENHRINSTKMELIFFDSPNFGNGRIRKRSRICKMANKDMSQDIFSFPRLPVRSLFPDLENFSGLGEIKSQMLDGKWKTEIDLSSMPTKIENISVKIKDSSIIIAGISEKSGKSDGMEIKSSHSWEKSIKIPEKVDSGTVTAKMTDNRLFICGEVKVEQGQEIKIHFEGEPDNSQNP